MTHQHRHGSPAMRSLLGLLCALFLTSLPSGLWAQEENRLMTESELWQHYSVKEEDGGTSQTTRLKLTLGEVDGTMIPARARPAMMLIGRESKPPVATITGGRWRIYQEGAVVATASLGDKTEWGSLGIEQITPRVTFVDRFRIGSLYRLEFNTSISLTPGADRKPAYAVLDAAEIGVDVGVGDGPRAFPEDTDLHQYDPYYFSFTSKVVSNPSQLGIVAEPLDPDPEMKKIGEWNTMLAEAGERGPILFGKIPRGGIYSIRAEALRTSGIDTSAFALGRLRLFLGPQEVPFYEVGATNGKLEGKAQIIFYAPHDKLDRKPYTALWLFVGDEGEHLRLKPNRVESDTAHEPAITNAMVERTIFTPTSYYQAHPLDGPQLRWLTKEIPRKTMADFDFDLPVVNENVPAQVTVWTTGMMPPDELNYEVLVNGQLIGKDSLRGVRVRNLTLDFPSGILHEGTNKLTIFHKDAEHFGGTGTMGFYQAKFRIPVSSTGIAPHEPGDLTVGATGVSSVAFRNATGTGFLSLAFDVSNPTNPTMYELTRSYIRGSLIQRGLFDFKTTTPTLVHASDESFLPVLELATVTAPRSFRETSPVDYLCVHFDGYEKSLAPLLAKRALTKKVDSLPISDVYAAFSYGEISYRALAKALRHAFSHREGARLSNVLLVGEGSEYWWEYRRGGDDVSPNQLPIYGWQDDTRKIRGDDGYALVSGNGPMADFEIGRISVNNAKELDGAVRKILKYEGTPPAGEWFNRHVFVTDDEPEFASVARDVVRKTFSGPNFAERLFLQDFPYEDYFRGILRKRSVVMTDKILDQFTRGARTMTYFGHGGPNLWSSERILHLRDLESIDDGGRHPVLVSGSCDTGWVDYPQDPVKMSLAEAMIRHEAGGPVAAFIPIDGTSSYEHNFLITGFYRGLIHEGMTDVGTICLYSKMEYLRTRSNSAVTNQFLLMGDPDTTMPTLESKLKLAAAPIKLMSITGEKLTVGGEAEGIDWGLAKVSLLDTESQPVAEKGFRVFGKRFSGDIKLPYYLKPGSYRLVALAYNEAEGKQLAGSLDIEISAPDIKMEWTTQPPLEEVVDAGKPIKLTLRIANDTPLDLAKYQLRITDRTSTATLAQVPVSLAAGKSDSMGIDTRIPLGLHFYDAKLYLPTQEVTEDTKPIAMGTLQLRGTDGSARYIAIQPRGIELQRRANPPGTTFRVPIYNMTEVELKDLSAALRMNLPGEKKPLGDIMKVPAMKVGGETTLEYRSTEVFKPGAYPFALELFDMSRDKARPLQVNLFKYDVRVGPDLEVKSEEIVLDNEQPISGTTVFVTVPIRNIGDEAISDIRGALYINAPYVSGNEARSVVPLPQPPSIASLQPGEKQVMRLRWDPFGGDAGGLKRKLFVTVSSQQEGLETSLANNVAEKELTFVSPPNLALVSADVKCSHKYVRPYDLVRFSIPVANTSKEDFVRSFRVGGTSISNAGVRTKRFTRIFDHLAAGETATLDFDWIVQPGETAFEINVNEDREYLESTTADNVRRFDFEYVLDGSYFAMPAELWDFRDLPEFGTFASTERLPNGMMTVSENPSEDKKALDWDGKYLVGGKVGNAMAPDNMWGLQNGTILLAFSETADPVKFHFPMDTGDGTTIYNIRIPQIGQQQGPPFSGRYRYRLEGADQWNIEDRPKGNDFSYGRIETRDDNFDIELSPADVPSLNHLFRVEAFPSLGRYTTPIIMATSLPKGRLIADAVKPSGTRIKYEVRYGHGSTEMLTWTPWQDVQESEVLPAAPVDATALQMRLTLFNTLSDSPRFAGMAIEMKPGKGPIASAESSH